MFLGRTNEKMVMETENVTVVGSQKKIGMSSNKVTSVKITDQQGNDVTMNYSIIYLQLFKIVRS